MQVAVHPQHLQALKFAAVGFSALALSSASAQLLASLTDENVSSMRVLLRVLTAALHPRLWAR